MVLVVGSWGFTNVCNVRWGSFLLLRADSVPEERNSPGGRRLKSRFYVFPHRGLLKNCQGCGRQLIKAPSVLGLRAFFLKFIWSMGIPRFFSQSFGVIKSKDYKKLI
jgi:hypothetical protein